MIKNLDITDSTIDDALSGNTDAIACIIMRYEGMIRRIISGIIYNDSDVDDLKTKESVVKNVLLLSFFAAILVSCTESAPTTAFEDQYVYYSNGEYVNDKYSYHYHNRERCPTTIEIIIYKLQDARELVKDNGGRMSKTDLLASMNMEHLTGSEDLFWNSIEQPDGYVSCFTIDCAIDLYERSFSHDLSQLKIADHLAAQKYVEDLTKEIKKQEQNDLK